MHRNIVENCCFSGRGGHDRVSFYDSHTVTFHNCEFRDFTSYVVVVVNEKNYGTVSFLNCSFENCYLYESRRRDEWRKIGAIIHADGTNEFLLDRCSFVRCGVVNEDNYFSSAIILNEKATVNNCFFHKCWGYHNTHVVNVNNIDPEDPKRTLFAPGTMDENNTIEDSANFS